MRTSTGARLIAADAQRPRALEHAQQLRLHASGSSPISSRNSVPPSRDLERPACVAIGAGERAALVAEQLALEQRLGQRRAVDGDERPLRRAATPRGPRAATSSLPVPVSPWMSTGIVERASRRASS